ADGRGASPCKAGPVQQVASHLRLETIEAVVRGKDSIVSPGLNIVRCLYANDHLWRADTCLTTAACRHNRRHVWCDSGRRNLADRVWKLLAAVKEQQYRGGMPSAQKPGCSETVQHCRCPLTRMTQ